MSKTTQQETTETKNFREEIQNFHLPRYHEIPDVGLFLEQTVRLVNQYLQPLYGTELTSSMISNYVKHKLIAPPHKKQYRREQIAYLIFMGIAKNALSLEDIRLLFTLQRENYSSETAYNYFCEEFENVLYYIMGIKTTVEEVGTGKHRVKELLRAIIITVACKIHSDSLLREIKEEHID